MVLNGKKNGNKYINQAKRNVWEWLLWLMG